jgi:hypothetical protein
VIDEVPLLSPEEAHDVVATLDAIRSAWVVRDGKTRAFATLGRATYLDLCCGRSTVDEYRARAAEQNEHLRRNFGDLLETVRAKIQNELQQRAVLTSDWALPGFHIFTGQGLRGAGTGGAHFDLQFRELIGSAEVEADGVLSFTLPVELPEAGSGLRVWPIRPAQLHGSSRSRDGTERLIEYLARKPSIYIRYRIGALYIQREPILHCIWNADTILPSDRRITLQGHGLNQGDGFVLYW